jgi:tetratricopeptide (TPR) repeat protein
LDLPATIPTDKLKRNVILFIDDLPSHYLQSYATADLSDPRLAQDCRQRFENAIARFRDIYGTKFRIVATAIREPEQVAKLPLQDPIWKSFKVYELPDLAREQCQSTLEQLEKYLQLQITDEARVELADKSDGTFSGLIVPLVKERAKGKTRIDVADVREYRCVYPQDWEDRVYGQLISPYKYRRAIVAAASLIRQARMTPFTFLVLEVARRLAGEERIPWLTTYFLKRALLELADWLQVSGNIVRVREAYLEGKADLKASKDNLLAAVFSLMNKPKLVVRLLTGEPRFLLRLRSSLYEFMDVLFHELDDPESSILVNKWLLDRNPDNARPWTRLAETYVAVGRYTEADEACEKAINLADNPSAWIIRASAYLAQKRFQESANACRAAIGRGGPGRAIYWIRLATALGGMANDVDALDASMRAVRVEPESSFAHVSLAISYDRMGELAKAIAEANEALSLESDNAVAWLTLGRCLSKAGKHAEAISACDKAIVIAPGSATAWEVLGRVQEKSGALCDALESFGKAVDLNPMSAGLRVSHGIALSKACKKTEATAMLHKAVELDSHDARARLALALELLDGDKVKDAELQLREAIRLMPDLTLAHSNLATILLKNGETAEAEKEARRAMKLEPKMADAYFTLGLILVERGDRAGAEAAFRGVLDLRPENARAHTYLANLMLRRGEIAEAEKEARRATELGPNMPEACFALGLVLAEKDDEAGAEAAFRKALDLKPEHALARCNLASVLLHKGHTAEAEKEARRATELGPDMFEAYFTLGLVLVEKDDGAGAEAAFRKVIDLKPENGRARCHLVDLLLQRGEIAEAEEEARRATELDPDMPQARFVLGLALLMRGESASAHAALLKAISLTNAQSASACSHFAQELLKAGQTGEALVAALKAAELRPDIPGVHFTLGLVHVARREFAEAETCFRRAVNLRKDSKTYMHLGRVLREQRKLPEAKQIYEDALATSPQDVIAAEAHLGLGLVCRKMGDLQGSEAEIRKALALTPEFFEAQSQLGRVLYEQKQYHPAIVELRKALDLEPNKPRTLDTLGRALWAVGEVEEAKVVFAKAVRLEPKLADVLEADGYGEKAA